LAPTSRAKISLQPPAAKPTIKCTGRFGKSLCARAGTVAAASIRPMIGKASAHKIERREK
jgi:hypothetical protein